VKHEPGNYFYYSSARVGQTVVETEVETQQWTHK
jgi:hypothetical protein